MSAIRDWTFNYTTSTTGTTIAATLPTYQQNDLLLAIVSTDTGTTQAWSSTGWTQLFSVSNTNNLGVIYKIAGASETDPTFTYTIAETANVHLLSIRDVNTTTPFNGTGGAGTGYITASNSAAVASLPQLTTTVANSLIIYICSESGAVVPGILQGPVTQIDAADGAAHSEGCAWGFMASTGATSTNVKCNKSGTAAGVLATIGISPPSGGATVIPAYCANDASLYIDPIHGVTAFNGNTAFAATATTNAGTTLNGKTLSNGTAAAAADVGINSFHSLGQVTGVTTAGTWAGGSLVLAAGNKPDLTGKNVICHVKPSTPKIYQNTDPLSKTGVKGVAFGMFSTAATAGKMWHVHGAGTAWDTAQHLPIVINEGNSSGMIQNNGSFAPSSVASFTFAISGFLVAPVFQFGSLWGLDTTTIAGGNSTLPIDAADINTICSVGKERMSIIQQGSAQVLVMQPIQFGDGGTNPTYLDLNGTAIEFPEQYSVADKQVYYCSVDNAAGLTYYGGASDTIKHRNSVVSSKSRYFFKLHTSHSTSCNPDFSGLSVIGAGTISLARAVTITELTINDYSTLDVTGLTLNSGTILNPPATSASITTGTTAVLNLCSINVSTLTAGNWWWAGADPTTIFTNCAFTGGGGHALSISATGGSTLTLTGNTWTGFGGNGTTGAALLFTAGSGTVTVNIVGGGTPTYKATGMTINFVNAKTVKVTVKDANTLVAIQNARVLLEADTGGDLPAGESVTITRSGSTASVSHTAHGMSAGNSVVIRGANQPEYNGIYTISNVTTNAYDYTVSGTPATPATGTITATCVILNGLTDASGILQTTTFNYTNPQPVAGKVRRATAAYGTKYKGGTLTGTITSSGLDTAVLLISDE